MVSLHIHIHTHTHVVCCNLLNKPILIFIIIENSFVLHLF